MTHLNELYLILNKSLKWNKSHLKCFALIMLVIILKQTCNLSSASKALPIKCLPQSFYRRMQRFFAGQYFDYRQISQLIFNMFSFDQVQLTLDRTNWKWGKRNINILMLAIVYRGIAIPILWTLLNKRGNSDTKERIALIQRFILMNPLMILVKIIKLRWIHILSYDQMVSRKINNQTTRCANSIFYTTLFTNSAPNYT